MKDKIPSSSVRDKVPYLDSQGEHPGSSIHGPSLQLWGYVGQYRAQSQRSRLSKCVQNLCSWGNIALTIIGLKRLLTGKAMAQMTAMSIINHSAEYNHQQGFPGLTNSGTENYLVCVEGQIECSLTNNCVRACLNLFGAEFKPVHSTDL